MRGWVETLMKSKTNNYKLSFFVIFRLDHHHLTQQKKTNNNSKRMTNFPSSFAFVVLFCLKNWWEFFTTLKWKKESEKSVKFGEEEGNEVMRWGKAGDGGRMEIKFSIYLFLPFFDDGEKGTQEAEKQWMWNFDKFHHFPTHVTRHRWLKFWIFS